MLADVVERDSYAGQFDVSTAFLNGDPTRRVPPPADRARRSPLEAMKGLVWPEAGSAGVAL
jgi:hypothetical protein